MLWSKLARLAAYDEDRENQRLEIFLRQVKRIVFKVTKTAK